MIRRFGILIIVISPAIFSCKKSAPTEVTCICRNVQGVVTSNQSFPDSSASAQCTALTNYSQTCRLE